MGCRCQDLGHVYQELGHSAWSGPNLRLLLSQIRAGLGLLRLALAAKTCFPSCCRRSRSHHAHVTYRRPHNTLPGQTFVHDRDVASISCRCLNRGSTLRSSFSACGPTYPPPESSTMPRPDLQSQSSTPATQSAGASAYAHPPMSSSSISRATLNWSRRLVSRSQQAAGPAVSRLRRSCGRLVVPVFWIRFLLGSV
jgi:hypothetical protein